MRKNTLGAVNFWTGRLMAQANKLVTPVTYLMVLITGMENHPEFLFSLPLILVGTVLWYFVDTGRVLEEELDYSYRRIPFLREISNDIKELKVQLNDVYKRQHTDVPGNVREIP